MDSPSPIADIPQLPAPETPMTWRDLNGFRDGERGSRFYETCLEYGQVLWRQGLPARAILCLDRAWGAAMDGSEPILKQWPLPYHALCHLIAHAPEGAFLGNPRVHFQHYADRLGEPRKEQRKWRSWACWALIRRLRPDLPADPRHKVEEPTLDQIAAQLDRHGHPGETRLWQEALESCPPIPQILTKG